MSQSYPYTKASVNSDKLKLEIEADETIVKTLEGIKWDAPDSLSITFDLALSGAEETALDTLVTNHDGNPPTTYDYFCYNEGLNRSEAALSTPTQCYVCASTDIQDQYHKCNFIATTDPTVDNDITEDYCVGSPWINTTSGDVFKCVDNTEGAAVWKNLTTGGGGTHTPWLLDIFSTAGVLFGGNDNGFCYIGAAGAITATEAYSQIRMPKGRVVAITGNCYNAASNGTFTVRKDGVDTGVTGTISATGQFRITGTGPTDFDGTEVLSFAYSTTAGGGLGVRGLQVEYESEVVS